MLLHQCCNARADDGDWPQGKQTTAILLQEALEDLLHKYQVDLALSGLHCSAQLRGFKLLSFPKQPIGLPVEILQCKRLRCPWGHNT
jgi:hypothetical protein